MQNELSSLQNERIDLASVNAVQRDAITELSASLEALHGRVNAVELNQPADFTTRFNELSSGLDNNEGMIRALSQHVIPRVKTIEGRVSTLDGKITELSNDVIPRVDSLDETSMQLINDLAVLTYNQDILDAKFDRLKGVVSAIQESL